MGSNGHWVKQLLAPKELKEFLDQWSIVWNVRDAQPVKGRNAAVVAVD